MSTDETPRPGADVQRGGPGKTRVTVTSGPLVDTSDNEQRPATPDDLWAPALRPAWLFEPLWIDPPPRLMYPPDADQPHRLASTWEDLVDAREHHRYTPADGTGSAAVDGEIS